jgi:hypothetical protein
MPRQTYQVRREHGSILSADLKVRPTLRRGVAGAKGDGPIVAAVR